VSHKLRACMAAIMLLLGPSPAFARKAEPPPPATLALIDNVNGLTTDADGHLLRFNGLLIDRDGRVVERLSSTDKRPASLIYRKDGGGRTLIPGFVDGQASLIATGIALMSLDLTECANLAEAQAKIAAYVHDNPDRKWILGRGWSKDRWGLALPPTPADLDSVTGGVPTFIESMDGKTGWANSAALKIAGALNPTGPKAKPLSSEEVQRRLRAVLPQPSAKDRDIALDKAQRLFLSTGHAAATGTTLSIDDWQALRRMGDRGALRLRIFGYARGLPDMLTIAGPEPTPWLYDNHLRLGGVSFPFPAPAPPSKSPQATAILNQMSRAAMDDFQVALALGATPDQPLKDAATALFAEMAATYKGDRRWRTDEMMRDSQGTWRGKSSVSSTARYSLGSASPVTKPAPFAALADTVGEGMDVGAALAALTRAPAHAAFAERITGALTPGQQADFLILDRNIEAATAPQVRETKVLENWIGGKAAWVSAQGVSAQGVSALDR
jgi:predicted amidohydrolase YtcJ